MKNVNQSGNPVKTTLRKKRWSSAQAALKPLRSGMRVFIGSGAAAPQSLISAMSERGDELFDVEVCHGLTLGPAPYAHRDFLDRFRPNALHIGRNVRAAVHDGVADYTAISLSEIPALFRANPFDIALVQVSEPDSEGWCSLGVSVDIVKAAVENAHYVVAEINQRMPRTRGDSCVHISKLSAIVKTATLLPQHYAVEPTPEALKIGEFVARLVEDGSTLRIGHGDLPSAVLDSLIGKSDLGFHGELLTDNVLPLIEKGVLTGSAKSLLPGKIVASTCLGSQRLFDYINRNSKFEFRPADYVADPFIIAQNRRMVSIGTAIEVDLTGQVCGDSVGDHFFSGVGAELDFMRGAARSEGGKSIVVLNSTAPHHQTSRIVPSLRPGSSVTATRADVHYVVTEHGIASLHGKSIRERILALINVAHPKFRDELMRYARDRRWVHPFQISIPTEVEPYPKRYESTARFKRTTIFFRPILPTDEGMVKGLFYSHSKRTVLNRYFTPLSHLSREMVQRFVNIDYKNDMAVVGLARHEGRQRMICVGRYFLDLATNYAEFAITVHDDFQGCGLGRHLMRTLVKIAREHGIAGFTAEVRAGNQAMLRLVHGTAKSLDSRRENGIYHFRFSLDNVNE